MVLLLISIIKFDPDAVGAGALAYRDGRFNYHQFCFAPGLNILNQHRTPFEPQS